MIVVGIDEAGQRTILDYLLSSLRRYRQEILPER